MMLPLSLVIFFTKNVKQIQTETGFFVNQKCPFIL